MFARKEMSLVTSSSTEATSSKQSAYNKELPTKKVKHPKLKPLIRVV